jgi:hypothetical protein
MSDLSLDLPPEHRALLEKNAILREELVRLLTEEHDLLHIVKPNLLALYQKQIGAWELRGLQAQVAELRARRRLEMAQAAINRGRKPELIEIDAHLELEFMAWQQKLQESAEALNAATERLENLLPDAENRELKKLYYALVKRLHPDVNPDLGAHEQRLWLRVQAAYEDGNVGELKALALLAQDAASGPAPTTPETLRAEEEVLRGQIAAVLQRIERWEGQPPFTLRPQLADEAWLAQRRQEIEDRIAQLDAKRAALDAQLRTLFPAETDGTIFGLN